MTDIYTQENGSKKKFLAPLLVILLCMVSLTAAGYAYSATVTNTDDSVIIDGVTLELKNGDDNVTTPMFAVNAHVGSHTTNGFAIDYAAAVGFKAADAAPVAFEGSTTGFLSGYYVALYNGNSATSAGYHAAIDTTAIDSAAELEAAIAAGTVAMIGTDTYDLKVSNHATSTVTLSVKAKWAADVDAFAGFNGVFVVVKNAAGNVVAVEKVGTDDTAVNFSEVAATGDSTYTVEAYVALSDYYSENVPTDLAFDKKFNVFFKAATA